MNIFSVLKELYTNKSCSWIRQLDENELVSGNIQPFLIQRWLIMNDSIRVQTRWLDKYVFVLSPKMYLSLAWSIIPKSDKAPFIKYIKKENKEEEFDFILNRGRHHMNLSDNDYNANKSRILDAIKKDMKNWFAFYGIPKKYWKQYYLNFNYIKEFGKKPNGQKGLAAFGL